MRNIYKEDFKDTDFSAEDLADGWIVARAIKESHFVEKDASGKPKPGILVKPNYSDTDPSKSILFEVVCSASPVAQNGEKLIVVNQAVNQLAPHSDYFAFEDSVVIYNHRQSGPR